MSIPSIQNKHKPFAIRAANQMLPLVQSIVTDIYTSADEVQETRDRLEYLNAGRVTERCDDVYAQELESIEKHTQEKSVAVDSWIEELESLGVLTENVTRGFVDFPATKNGQAVCLCWKLGEREINFWHHLDESCCDRRPVDLELIRQSGDLNLINGA